MRRRNHHQATQNNRYAPQAFKKRNLSTVLAVLLCAATLLTSSGCTGAAPSSRGESASSGSATLANPLVEVKDVAAINSQLDLSLALPVNATAERCTIIDNTLGEVSFTLDGQLYNYRGMVTNQDEDISGLYYDFTSHDSREASGQIIEMEYNDGGPGHARWFIESSGTVYSVSVENGASKNLLDTIAVALIAEQG